MCWYNTSTLALVTHRPGLPGLPGGDVKILDLPKYAQTEGVSRRNSRLQGQMTVNMR
jgi:hypothetical protein